MQLARRIAALAMLALPLAAGCGDDSVDRAAMSSSSASVDIDTLDELHRAASAARGITGYSTTQTTYDGDDTPARSSCEAWRLEPDHGVHLERSGQEWIAVADEGEAHRFVRSAAEDLPGADADTIDKAVTWRSEPFRGFGTVNPVDDIDAVATSPTASDVEVADESGAPAAGRGLSLDRPREGDDVLRLEVLVAPESGGVALIRTHADFDTTPPSETVRTTVIVALDDRSVIELPADGTNDDAPSSAGIPDGCS